MVEVWKALTLTGQNGKRETDQMSYESEYYWWHDNFLTKTRKLLKDRRKNVKILKIFNFNFYDLIIRGEFVNFTLHRKSIILRPIIFQGK